MMQLGLAPVSRGLTIQLTGQFVYNESNEVKRRNK